MVGIRTLAICLEVVVASLFVLLPIGNLYVTLVAAAFLGFFTVPILPSSYAFVAKITVGMAPSVVNGLMMSSAQLYSFVGSLIGTWLIIYGQRIGLSWSMFTQSIAVLSVLCIRYEGLPESVLTDPKRPGGVILTENQAA